MATIALLAGCSSSEKSAGPTPSTIAIGGKSGVTVQTSPPQHQVKNPWFPLVPGYQTIRDGHLNRGHNELTHRRIYTITGMTKMIHGIKAIVGIDQDLDAGEIAENALEFLALDKEGNILYLGSYTEAYEGGEFLNATDAWLAGVNGAVGGVLVPGHKARVGDEFLQADLPGDEPTKASVDRLNERVCEPFKCYAGAIVIKEGNEFKYYAPDVGGVKTEPNYSGGEQETEELVNVVRLSPQSLEEINDVIARLDRHAREVAPDVFGNSAPVVAVS